MRDAMVFPFRWFDTLRQLPDAERLQMLDAIRDYAECGKAPEFTGVMAALWNEFKQRIDHDIENYDRICEARRQAGARGGQATQSKNKQKQANQANQANASFAQATPSKPSCAEADAEAEAKKKTVSNETAKEGATASFDLFDLPASLNCREFLDKWQEWLDYRKSVKKKVSALAAKKQIKFLSQYDLATAIAVIDQSIANDWQGLFPPGNANSGNSRVGATAVSPEQDEQRRQKRVAELREFRESLGIVDPFEQAEGMKG